MPSAIIRGAVNEPNTPIDGIDYVYIQEILSMPHLHLIQKNMSSVTDSPREGTPGISLYMVCPKFILPSITVIVTKKQLRSLRKLLAPEQYRWFQLGCQMRIPIDKLKKIEREVGRKPPDQCFLGVLNMFFSKNPEERKWHVSNKLATSPNNLNCHDYKMCTK